MRYLDVCAGISASTVAWKPLGWEAAAYSEIEAAPRAVLSHHYPDTPLHGDFTTIKGDEYGPIDLLVGGTPCQDFSVAGLRAGLDGDRGNLSLEFLRLADRARPRWVVWENVPGVLSIDGGRAFGAILGGLGELGYGFAYRVLDAQFFGVPQRRRRVFVVGCAGDWRRAGAVLSERHSLSGHPAPRREAGQGTSGRIARSLAIRGREGHSSAELGDELANAILTPSGSRAGIGVGAALISSTGDTAHCLNAGGMGRQDFETETLLAQVHEATHDVAGTMMSYAKSGGDSNRIDNAAAGYMCITHALRGEGFDASEDGTGRGTPLVPVYAVQERAVSENVDAGPQGKGWQEHVAYTLEARHHAQAVAFDASTETMYGVTHADAAQTDPDQALRALRDAVGEEAYSEWCAGILAAFRSPEILRSKMYGRSIRWARNDWRELGDDALSCPQDGAAWPMLALWQAGCLGRSPRGWEPPEQLARELVAHLSKLPHQRASAARFLLGLWRTSEGLGLLREALSALQEAWRPAGGEGQSARLTSAVRRLTPIECERLMGFPDDYTLVPHRGKPMADGPRYKALGNSMAVPVMRWIGERIAAMEALVAERIAA